MQRFFGEFDSNYGNLCHSFSFDYLFPESQASKADVQAAEEAFGGDEKRGHIFRYGRANVFRYGKRAPSVFRYGKRSVFRYGKRSDDGLNDQMESLFPKRIFRYGKRTADDDDDDLYEDPLSADGVLGKRMVFRYGKRGDDVGEEVEEDDGKILIEKIHKEDETFKDKDEKRPIFRYGRSARLPNAAQPFGVE